MKSPFPGMDPYLEHHWLDVHSQLIARSRDALNRVLPEDLVARSEERLAVESELPSDTVRFYGPDVRVFEPGTSDERDAVATITAPFKLVVDLDPITDRFVRIIR